VRQGTSGRKEGGDNDNISPYMARNVLKRRITHQRLAFTYLLPAFCLCWLAQAGSCGDFGILLAAMVLATWLCSSSVTAWFKVSALAVVPGHGAPGHFSAQAVLAPANAGSLYIFSRARWRSALSA